MGIKIRFYITIVGILVFYTFLHEFAYRQYEQEDIPGYAVGNQPSRAIDSDTLPDSSGVSEIDSIGR